MTTPTDSTDEQALTDMRKLLQLQKRAVLDEGIPDLRLRVDRLDRLAALLTSHREEIAEAISEDFGNRPREANLMYDVLALLGSIEHARQHLAGWMQVETYPEPAPGAEARVEFQPKGVIGVVSPWNLPVQLSIGPVIGIVGAGNRAILKPSELTPATSELLKNAIGAAFDESELAVVTGSIEVAAAFTALEFDHLVFTGATAVGRHVARAAADKLVPLTLELGGKSPVIIGKTADLQHAANRISIAKTLNAGQTCVSPDYVFIPEGKEQAFIDEFTSATTRMFPTLDENRDYTTIINERHFDRLMGLVNDARAKGAEVIEIRPADEDLKGSETRRIAPTLILNVQPGMKILGEEIFGPILLVMNYSALDEAIDFINARPRPLALYYFGNDAAEERRVLDATVSGGVTVNDCIRHITYDYLPFGGVGDSGMGAYHGRYGFLTFSHARAVYRAANTVSAADELAIPPFGAPLQNFLANAFAEPSA